jgi:hypothetical protein
MTGISNANEVDAVIGDAVTMESIHGSADELIDDEVVEPGCDQCEAAGRRRKIAFVQHEV